MYVSGMAGLKLGLPLVLLLISSMSSLCSATCSLPCHANATCNAADTCVCNAGYTGNGTTCDDTERPVFDAGTCPPSMTHVADPRSMTTSVTWTDPTATDTTNVTPTVTCSPSSGSDFTIGNPQTVTCTARDAAENTAMPDCTFTVTVTDFDECTASSPNRHDCHVNAECTNTPGSFTCMCNAGYTGNGQDCQDDPPVIGTCPSSLNGVANPGTTTTTSVTWTKPTATDTIDTSPTVTCSPASGSSLTIGSFQVTCTASDNAGNTDTCTFTVTITDFDECNAAPGDGGHVCVNADCMNTDGGYSCNCHPGYSKPNNMDDTECTDTERPVFDAGTCPPSMTHVADPRSMTTSVTWTDPTAMDSTGVTPTVTCSPASGYAFTIGSETVTCTARDAAGNTAMPDCTFTVTVTDFDECTNSHDCDTNAECSNTPGSFTCMCNAGYTGNGRDCQDNDPPVFDAGTCPPSMNEVADPRSMTTSVTWNGPTATDSTNVAPTVTCSPSSGSLFTIGDPQTVTCTARDAAGNTAMPDCTFTVTVTDFNECTASGTGRHDCNANANCTNTDGGFDCTCKAGYSGNGTMCTMCSQGFYGVGCLLKCTCITGPTAGALCDHVNGLCTCTPAFTGAVCDKDHLSVQLSVKEPVLDTNAIDVAILRCNVNLHSRDLQLPVTITFSNGSIWNATLRTEGLYEVTINDVKTTDSGTYRCNATTLINGVSTPRYDDLALDVLAPGRIISLTERVEGKLDASVSLDCAVFAPPPPNITWYDHNNMIILESNTKYGISRTLNETENTSTLRVMNLQRVDNGTYTCETSNNLTDEIDQRLADVIVTEVPEVDGVSAVALESDEIEVSWVITFDGNVPLFQCKVEYKTDDIDWTITPFKTDPPLSRRIRVLKPYTTYTAKVICKNTVGEGVAALLMNPVTTKQAAPSAPLNVGISGVAARTLTVVWDEPDIKRGTIAFYQVSATDMTTDIIKTSRTNGNPTSLLVTGLLPFRNYTVFVTAVNMEGSDILESQPSDSVVKMTGEAIPSAPLNVSLDNAGDTCNVTWDPPMDENGIILSYTIYLIAYKYPDLGSSEEGDLVKDVSKFEMRQTQDVNTRILTLLKSELAPYARFKFEILATTSPGAGPRSVPTNITCDTPKDAPEVYDKKPRQPIGNDDTPLVTADTFLMSFEPASTINGPISCYDITVVRLENDDSIVGMKPDDDYPVNNLGTYVESQSQAGKAYVAITREGNKVVNTTTVTVGGAGSTTCGGPPRRRKRQAAGNSGIHSGNDGRLISNTRYTAFVRAYVIREDGEELYTTSPLMEPVMTVNEAAVVIGVVLALLIVVVLALVGLIYMKRKQQMPLLRYQENGVSLEPMKEAEPEITHMVVLPIALEDLPDVVKTKTQNDDEIFKNEFKSIPESTGNVTREASRHDCNKEKNRYINIVAYDETRVRLTPIDGVEGSDYVNACFVDGYEKSRKFIAAQGPREDTVLDFWRMIWEQNCSTIIMLTKCLENGREKCAEYWPEEDAIMYDDIIVTLDDVVTCADYVIRKFTMQKSIETEEDEEPIVGERRTLMQFHFLGWPDFGIPKYPHSMLCFVKRIRHMVGNRIEPGNIVVHCSAGVGRTGTYILIDSMLDMMKKEKKVDIYNVIYKIRSQRNLLVQSLVQYVFIHKAISEEYLYGHTEVDVGSVHVYYKKLCSKKTDDDLTGVESEYRTVASLPVENTDQKTGNLEPNKQKNRLRQVIPYDRNRVKLERLTGQEHSNYINASFIDGYEHKKAYVAAQGPLPNTMGDFWRLAWENQCSTIVMLTECEEKGQNVCSKYWPNSGENETHAFLTVSVKEQKEESDDYTIRDLEVSTTKGAGTKLIRQYHYHGWPEVGVPESSASLVKVIGLAHEYQQDIGRFPVLVHCSAGSGRTGVFIALSYLLQKAKAEGIVDIFQTVRALRQQRPHMVQDVAQYQFCYRAMMEYLDSFDHYANFK